MTPLCQKCDVRFTRLTFNFCCRTCSNSLDRKGKRRLTMEDYIIYFETTYQCDFSEYYYFITLRDIHDHFIEIP